MIVELFPGAGAAASAALASGFAAHPDVTAWPVRFGDRTFVVVSGDESLVPEVDSPLVAAVHSTAERGYWLTAAENGVVPDRVAVGDGVVGGGVSGAPPVPVRWRTSGHP
ncbi:hypothetical protein HFP72_29525 [Nocardiopsis sp. ARC36]